MATRDLTAARLRELVNYDHETGIFTWRRSRHGVYAGAVAGGIKNKGYIFISIDGATHQAHRLAWLHVYGRHPEQHIDHINGVRHDNRISNLRDVSPKVNAENMRSAMPTNKSGVLGVRKGRCLGRWEAWIVIAGKRVYIGVYGSPEEAHAAYVTTKRIHHEGCTI